METSKSVFQLHGVDENEAVGLRRQPGRAKMIRYFEKLPPTLVAIESCGRRVLEEEGLPELAPDLFAFQAREYASVEARLEEIDAKLMPGHLAD